MNSSTMLAFCPASEFARIENEVREWPGVEAVGSLRTKERKKDVTNVFIKFESEDAAKNAISLVEKVTGLSLTDEESDEKKTSNKKNLNKGKNKNLAIEFFNFGTYSKQNKSSDNNIKKNSENYQRNRNVRGGGGRGRGGPVSGPGVARRGQYNERQSTVFRGGRKQNFFIPPAQVSVAFADNIPFNMTNEQLIELFSPFGRVFDINRYELMAMIFYDSPDSVLQCIQHLNGKTVKGNIISVSSGSVKIPGPAAMQMGI